VAGAPVFNVFVSLKSKLELLRLPPVAERRLVNYSWTTPAATYLPTHSVVGYQQLLGVRLHLTNK